MCLIRRIGLGMDLSCRARMQHSVNSRSLIIRRGEGMQRKIEPAVVVPVEVGVEKVWSMTSREGLITSGMGR